MRCGRFAQERNGDFVRQIAVMDQIDEKAVVADGQASAQSRVPEIAGPRFVARPVRRGNIRGPRQLVVWIVQLGGVPLLRGDAADIDLAVGTLKIISK